MPSSNQVKLQRRFGLGCALVLGSVVLSCNLSPVDETGAQHPTPQGRSAAPASKRVVERALPARADAREIQDRLVSAEVLAREEEFRQRFSGAIGSAPDRRLAFVDCESSPCLARITATSAQALQQTLEAVAHDMGGRVDFTARERLDPYMGRSFEADVDLDVEAPRAVPADVAELFSEGT